MTDVPTDTITRLAALRRQARERAARIGVRHVFPSRDRVAEAIDLLARALFPVRLGGWQGGATDEDAFVAGTLETASDILTAEIAAELAYWQVEASAQFDEGQAAGIVALRNCRISANCSTPIWKRR